MQKLNEDLSTSLTLIRTNLIVNLQSEMSNSDLDEIFHAVLSKIQVAEVKTVILNFSIVKCVDSYTFGVFLEITDTLNLMGIKTIWACLRPGVVNALVHLNLHFDFTKLDTALNLEQALDSIKA